MADSNVPQSHSSGQVGTSDQAQPSTNEKIPSQKTASSGVNKTSDEPSNAEKKRLAKAEKAARRAKAKEGQAPATNGATDASNNQAGSNKQAAETKSTSQATSQHKRVGSIGSAPAGPRPLPIRRRQSQSAGGEPKQTSKQVDFFSHLYGQSRRRGLDGTPKEIHPAVANLALQQSNYVICGSHARCVAMLLALKQVITSYTTPHGAALPRHLASNYLSPQLSYLISSRPFSTSQANSIRWLKNLIATLDPSMAEDDAKSTICSSIDTFIHERFTIADQVIADTASDRIKDGDVILTFGKSAVVQATLLNAAARGTDFRVVVVDARPLLEGRHLAQGLSSQVDVSYCLLPGLNHAMAGVTKCMLGAHAIFANGCLQSRVGSALVAMTAKQRHVPVIVCAESIKLTDRAALNSIILNELAPEEELVGDPTRRQTKNVASDVEHKSKAPTQSGSKDTKDKQHDLTGNAREIKAEEGGTASMLGWETKENLQLLNMLHDVTPAENIDLVITELGSFPPSSASIVHRISIGS